LIKALRENDLLDVLQFPVSMLDPQPEISAFVEKHGIGNLFPARGDRAGIIVKLSF
jgi:hypothetical protein